MSALERFADNKAVLPYISRFHELRVSRRALSLEERRLFALLEDLFEPRRSAPDGSHREEVKLTVYRSARVLHEGEVWPGRVCQLTLRSAKVLVSSASVARLGVRGAEVVLEIENMSGDTWFRFSGSVKDADWTRGCVVILLQTPLGTERIDSEGS